MEGALKVWLHIWGALFTWLCSVTRGFYIQILKLLSVLLMPTCMCPAPLLGLDTSLPAPLLHNQNDTLPSQLHRCTTRMTDIASLQWHLSDTCDFSDGHGFDGRQLHNVLKVKPMKV